MSSLSNSCSICANKALGVFKCQGCSNVFCRKHASEHRDHLNQQLETIFNEHNQLQQMINEQNSPVNHPLVMDIQRWEENSIRKIRQTAEELRQQIERSFQMQRGKRRKKRKHFFNDRHLENVSTTLKNLSQRLTKAREEDDYIETDLQIWLNKLTTLRNDLMSSQNSTLILREDVPLISTLILSSVQSKMKENERFSRVIGDVTIEDQGQTVIHGARKRSDAFVFGENEYFQGQHQIRFVITKKDARCLTTFGIVSQQNSSSVVGWNTNDETVGIRYSSSSSSRRSASTSKDFKGETILQIELIIDCDQRKLLYYNERTTTTREISVDLNTCPFPWRLYFYLFDTNDRVRLFPSIRSM